MATAKQQAGIYSHPGEKWLLITPGSSALSPRPRSIYIGVSGTIDITNEDDTTVSALPVFAGATLSMQPKKITAASSATVYGIYDNA